MSPLRVLLLPPHCCGLGAGSIPFRAIVNNKQCEMRGLFMLLVIHYWMGDVQDSQGVSTSEMTYIVLGGALNSTHSLTFHNHPFSIKNIFFMNVSILCLLVLCSYLFVSIFIWVIFCSWHHILLPSHLDGSNSFSSFSFTVIDTFLWLIGGAGWCRVH